MKPKRSVGALKLLIRTEIKQASKHAADAGTFGALFEEWRASPEWKKPQAEHAQNRRFDLEPDRAKME